MIGGSPSSGIWGRISQVHTVDATLGEWMLTTPEIYLGRERGTITFPADLFVSASHCRLRRGDGFAYLSDLGSTNGSYARIKDQTALSTGAPATRRRAYEPIRGIPGRLGTGPQSNLPLRPPREGRSRSRR